MKNCSNHAQTNTYAQEALSKNLKKARPGEYNSKIKRNSVVIELMRRRPP
jgi:hypothetical protein